MAVIKRGFGELKRDPAEVRIIDLHPGMLVVIADGGDAPAERFLADAESFHIARGISIIPQQQGSGRGIVDAVSFMAFAQEVFHEVFAVWQCAGAQRVFRMVMQVCADERDDILERF